ncbi:ABC transporter ATP-binding protein [Ferrovibrio terrae]|uniref:ABC transporter ATP-binding protein n=1 Tax=Ferrovibrio terrae TaxID=2594003 RepID=UPI003137865E
MSAAPAAAHLDIRDVSKRFGATTVLDGITLSVAAGELITLLGPSGCGKTTLLRAIAGLALPDSGTVTVAGRDITRLPPHKRHVGVVFQNYALFPHLSVRGNVAFGLRVHGKPKAEIDSIVDRYLGLVKLAHLAERPVSALSGGQQQRVALARALAVEPTIVLFDEALSALDRKLRESMQVELRQLLRDIGATAIFVTHDQDEALTMSDRIAVMNGGRIEQCADPKTVYAAPATLFALDFVGLSTKLKGRVVEVPQRGAIVVETAAGRLTARANFAVGSPVVLATRPEYLALSDAATGENVISGRLQTTVFHGSRSMLHVDAGSGAPLTVEISGLDAPLAGSAIHLRWPLEAGYVYPDPSA